MARTQYIFLQGKAKWARPAKPDPWGNYKVTLYLNNDSYNKFTTLGVKNTVKKDEDGYYVTLRRPAEKTIKGKVIGMGAVPVMDKDSVPMDNVMIGNGSDVTVKLEYYEYNPPGGGAKGHAIRLFSIRVDNLIPYTPEKDMMEDEEKAARGLSEQPAEPLF